MRKKGRFVLHSMVLHSAVTAATEAAGTCTTSSALVNDSAEVSSSTLMISQRDEVRSLLENVAHQAAGILPIKHHCSELVACVNCKAQVICAGQSGHENDKHKGNKDRGGAQGKIMGAIAAAVLQEQVRILPLDIYCDSAL